MLSSVTPPVDSEAWTGPTLSSAETMVGAADAAVSRVKATEPDGWLLLPAASDSITLMEWFCPEIGVCGVKLQEPSALTVVVPMSEPLSRMVMVSPTLPVPEMVGVVSLVLPPLLILPRTGA